MNRTVYGYFNSVSINYTDCAIGIRSWTAREADVAVHIPPRIAQIHRVISGICIAVGPDACLGHLKPVGLDKPAQIGVKVAGVQILEA